VKDERLNLSAVHMMEIVLLMIGLAAGFVFGMIGVGGGYVIIPGLIYILNFPVHVALGTSLLVSLIGASISAIYRYLGGDVKLAEGLIWAICAACGAFLGAHIACESPPWLIRSLFGIICILASVLMITKKKERERPLIMSLKSLISISILMGIISGLTGVPGGIFYATAFVLLFNMPIRIAAGTASLVMPFTAFSGALRFYLSNFVDTTAFIIISLAATITTVLGIKLSRKAPAHKLRKAFSMYLLYVGVVMLLGLRPQL